MSAAFCSLASSDSFDLADVRGRGERRAVSYVSHAWYRMCLYSCLHKAPSSIADLADEAEVSASRCGDHIDDISTLSPQRDAAALADPCGVSEDCCSLVKSISDSADEGRLAPAAVGVVFRAALGVLFREMSNSAARLA